MTDERADDQPQEPGAAPNSESGTGAESEPQQSEESSTGKERDIAGGFKDGIRQGLGVLSALKDAIEETITDAKSRGDLSQDKAKKVFRDAMNKAQSTADAAKDRFDFVKRQDFDDIVDSIDRRIKDLERKLGFGPAESTSEEESGADEPSSETPES